MSLDFQQVREQIRALGENVTRQSHGINERRLKAERLLAEKADAFDWLRQRVRKMVEFYDPNLRCALPRQENPEPLDGRFPLPPAPEKATILAADGSQISPDRHSEVNYCLINVGAIQMTLGGNEAPKVTVSSKLIFGDELITPAGLRTEQQLALERDFYERSLLVGLAETAPAPIASFTDGPMELWGTMDSAQGGAQGDAYQASLERYQEVLERLRQLNVAAAGYVDKPAANLVVRLLEVADAPEERLADVKHELSLLGVTDRHLFNKTLRPGERSAVFAIQSRSALQYRPELKIHFFYLNVGSEGRPWLARVEIPAWVARNAALLDLLHSVLVQQARILGARAYPYLLHRAHEAAVVSFEEKDQVTQMIVRELRNRGIEVDEVSHKQALKNQPGRASFHLRPQ